MEYDYDKVEDVLIKSIKKHLDLNEGKNDITAIKALKAFHNHYQQVSLDKLYFPESIEKFNHPDGDIFTGIHDVFHYVEGKRKNVHRKLEFQHHFYGYFEYEIIELRLYIFYKPLDITEKEKVSIYYDNEKLLDIRSNEWFEEIKDDKPLKYTIDINFNA